jgi:hypothetical protein
MDDNKQNPSQQSEDQTPSTESQGEAMGFEKDSGLKGGKASQQDGGQSGRDEQGQFEEGSAEASEAGKVGGSM